jgi:glutamate/tyrosine decarboxylase-like PLP-dependent enzyme
MSRGFRALKVWMTLKHYGVDGYRKLLAQSVHCAERLDELVRASDDFEALHEPNLFIYSFRYRPARLRDRVGEEQTASYLDRLNQMIADGIQASGFAFVMTTTMHERVVLRLSICSHRTTPRDIEAVFNKLGEIGAELDRKQQAASGPA